MRRLSRVIALVLCLSIVTLLHAQTPAPNPEFNLTFPPPVYVLGGEVSIYGSANLNGQNAYFLEYQPLNENTFAPREGENAAWFPATLINRTPVRDGLLGVWDTATAPDGLYALRLNAFMSDGSSQRALVTPLRVDNSNATPITVLDEDTAINTALLALTATASARITGADAFATLAPLTGGAAATATPTLIPLNGELGATVIILANLRQGDSTRFAISAGLNPGVELDVLGRSSRGNNWLLVETADGERGWVAPSVVRLDGNILDAPAIDPPPLPAPLATATPTALPLASLPDAEMVRVDVDRVIKQGEAFQILATVRNNGGAYLNESALFCNVEPMNVSLAFIFGNLQPGQSQTYAMPLRLDSGGGQLVNIICKIDMNEEIREANESNNLNRISIFLNNP